MAEVRREAEVVLAVVASAVAEGVAVLAADEAEVDSVAEAAVEVEDAVALAGEVGKAVSGSDTPIFVSSPLPRTGVSLYYRMSCANVHEVQDWRSRNSKVCVLCVPVFA